MSKRRGGTAPQHNEERRDGGQIVEHRLVLVDRNQGGERHRHQWQATCVCGWRAVATRRRTEAEERYRTHRNARLDAAKRAQDERHARPPRPPTPTADLPEALR